MFSAATPPRLAAPRPPTPMMAMFSFSFRFRPRTIAGAAMRRRSSPQQSGRAGDASSAPIEEKAEVSLMDRVPLERSLDRLVCPPQGNISSLFHSKEVFE